MARRKYTTTSKPNETMVLDCSGCKQTFIVVIAELKSENLGRNKRGFRCDDCIEKQRKWILLHPEDARKYART